MFSTLSALLAVPAAAEKMTTLQGHVPKQIHQAVLQDRAQANENVSLSLAVQLDDDLLKQTFHQLYGPKAPKAKHFLSSAEFAQKFGLDEKRKKIKEFALAQGLTIDATQDRPESMIVNVSGQVSHVENAFHVRLFHYKDAQGHRFRSPDTDPTIPASLAPHLGHVLGLSTLLGVAHPHIQLRPSPAKPKSATTLSNHAAHPQGLTGSGPPNTLAPSDIKTIYGLDSVSLNGSGQNVALVELDGYNPADVTTYESNFSLPHVPIAFLGVDGSLNKCHGQDCSQQTVGGDPAMTEPALDIEMVEALSPGVAQILFYQGPNSLQGLYDVYNKIATDNSAKVVSTSWGLPELKASSSFLQQENQVFMRMAIQGQSLFAAAGDTGAYDDGGQTQLAVDDPAAQPYVTSVGGTSLSGTLQVHTETVWNNGYVTAISSYIAGGGGYSVIWPIPDYQEGLPDQTAHPFRHVPDVALNADLYNSPYALYVAGSWYGAGGTSAGSPLWAALTTMVNQKRQANGDSPAGFINADLYLLGSGPNYLAFYNDITVGDNGYYQAGTGYDLSTGWGSFQGRAMIDGLVNPNQTPALVITSSAPLQGIVGQSFSAALQAAGGSTPYTWSIASGALPPGLLLDNTGTLSGTPLKAGFFNVTVQVQDHAASQVTQLISIAIALPLGAVQGSVIRSLPDSDHFFYGEPRIVRGPNNKLYAIYEITTRGSPPTDNVYYASSSDNGQTWVEETLATNLYDVDSVSGGCDIAIDASNNIHVVWTGAPSSSTLSSVWYRERTATGWQNVVQLNDPQTTTVEVHMAMDGKNNPHVLWVGALPSQWQKLFYRTRTAQTWQATEEVSTLNNNQFGAFQIYGQIAIDAQDQPHAIWMTLNLITTGAYVGVEYRKRTASGWGPEEQVTPHTLSPASIAIDSTGAPHVSWVDFGLYPHSSLMHRQRTASGWQTADDLFDTDTAHTFFNEAPGIAIDSLDQIHISGGMLPLLAALPNNLVYALRTAAGWQSAVPLNTGSQNSRPNFIGSMGPLANGARPSRPKTGFAFAAYTNDLNYYTSQDLSWDATGSPLIVTTANLPPGTLEQSYSAGLQASGGTPPYSWSLINGSLPDGLFISTSGLLSGTPSTVGSSSFTVQVNDSVGSLASEPLNITVVSTATIPSSAPVILGFDSLPPFVERGANLQLNVSGSWTDLQWTFTPIIGNSSSLSGASASIQAAGHGYSVATKSLTLGLGPLPLSLGAQQITVVAYNGSMASKPYTANFTLVSSDLSTVRVHPSPWRRNLHNGHPVTFDGLPAGSTVKIFAVDGHHVATLSNAAGSAEWSLKNENGSDVASGIYLYLVTSPQGKIHGKFVVIR
jgi:kumamolisin